MFFDMKSKVSAIEEFHLKETHFHLSIIQYFTEDFVIAIFLCTKKISSKKQVTDRILYLSKITFQSFKV